MRFSLFARCSSCKSRDGVLWDRLAHMYRCSDCRAEQETLNRAMTLSRLFHRLKAVEE